MIYLTILLGGIIIFLVAASPIWAIITILGVLYFPIFSTFNLGPVEISISTIPVLVLFGRALITWGRNLRKRTIPIWQYLLLVGMSLAFALATANSSIPSQAWIRYLNLILYVLILFSMVVLVRTPEDLLLIAKAILIYVIVDTIMPNLSPIRALFGIPIGVSVNGLSFKYYFAFAFCLVFLTQSSKVFSRAWRVVLIAAALLILWRVVTYQTRSSWVVIAVMVLLSFLRLPRRIGILMSGLAVGLVIGVFFFGTYIAPNITETQQAVSAVQLNDRGVANQADRIRLVSIDFGWKKFLQKPLTGWGPSTFATMIRNEVYHGNPFIRGGAFNSFLLVLVETGALGLIPVVLAFVLPLLIIWFSFKKIPEGLRLLAFAFVLGVFGTGIHLLFIDLLYTSQVWLQVGLAWAAAAMAVGAIKISKTNMMEKFKARVD